jgi:hypothetical protein
MPDADGADQGRANPRSLPGWIRPAFAAIGLGFVVAAVGGPDSLGRFSSISPEVLWVTAASTAAGGALMGWFALRTLSSSPAKSGHARQRGVGRFGLGIGGAVVLLVVGLRALTDADPIIASVIWGCCGGLMLIGALLPTGALIRPSR